MAGKSDNMSVEKTVKKEKNQNIQVVVRLRPPNLRERDLKSHSIVEVSNNKEIIVKPNVGFSKKFTFDRAFGPSSSQVEIYHEVVSPLISEVLNGYNCTVFAYGQTGTGKTHTMVGENTGSDLSWQNDPLAGIIPRALSQIFDELRIINSEYTIRVSYLELYNEELFDLLSASEDNSKLRIYEDSSRKGSNIVNGLEEVTVYSKSEVYKIMEKGQERRQIASTLMNAQSSRSHTVFTIVVHMKENSPEGEELMKIGKLNLVDLAGSENISKAGTDNPQKKERARECVNINQSLLTLGRVITALVERHPHIPYRESKLTRLLQESLGGRTKTSIIATISPGHRDMEETLSTLEYAHRAKNIQNKPEVNQKLTKKAVLKEYSEEIDRLKRDLQASREKNGVYLTNESYSEMLFRLDDQEKEIQNKILEIKSLMDEKDRLSGIFNELSFKLQEKEAVIETTTQDLTTTRNTLESTKQVLSQTSVRYQEQCYLVKKHVETESTLGAQAQNLLHTTNQLNNDVSHLHATVDKRKHLESKNLTLTKFFGEKSKNHHEQMKETLNTFSNSHQQDLVRIGKMADKQYTEYVKKETAKKEAAESLISITSEAIADLKEIRQLNMEKTCAFLHAERESMQQDIEKRAQDVESKMLKILERVSQLAQLGAKDKSWLEDINSFVVSRQNDHQSNHTKLRSSYDNVYSEMKSHLNILSTAYTRDMAEQMEIHKKFRLLSEQHSKEMEERNAALSNVLSLMKNEQEALALKNKEMYRIVANLNEENMRLVHERQNDFATMLKCEYTEAENTNELFVSTIDETMKSENDFMGQLIERYGKQSLVFKQESDSHLEIMTEVKDTINAQNKCFSESGSQMKLTMDKIISTQNETMDIAYEQLQEFNERCSSDLTQLAMSSDDLLKLVTSDGQTMQKEFSHQEENLLDFREHLNETLLEWDSMETEYLSKEYKVYSPTGKTPNRKDYQYPRQLAATSSHERLLKRFRSNPGSPQLRAMKPPKSFCSKRNVLANGGTKPLRLHPIEDLATIDLSESLMEASPAKEAKMRSSSNVSSLSDDSVSMFVEPAPKLFHCGVEKSTSEGDIRILMGSDNKGCKENFDGSSSSESKAFRSKLRKPMKKKILSEHNN